MTCSADIERVFRAEYGRCVATLIRLFGDIDLAEEAVQDAFTTALLRWPQTGLPPNPGAWITTTARNRAIDQLRREASRHDRHAQALLLHWDTAPEPEVPVHDDRLRLIFTCCHPALARSAQVALTLRLLGGLQTAEIARAFLVTETTMAQRLVRAKRKISTAGIPYRIPAEAELPGRVRGVLQATINAVHSDAARAADTRWDQILQLYDQLLEHTPTPVIALNRAVALAEVHGPQAALDLIDQLDLNTYQPYHATRADLLRRLGRKPEASAAYQAAIALSSNDTERAYLTGRLRTLS